MRIPKVFGIETEWSVRVRTRNSVRLANAKEFGVLIKFIREFFTLTNTRQDSQWEACSVDADRELEQEIDLRHIESVGYLPNGARLYVDWPHLEYSTPECQTIRDLIAADQAGNWLLNMAAKKASQLLKREIIIIKDNSDRKGVSYASHENYSLQPRTFKAMIDRQNSEARDLILPFLVTRQILAGAGKVGSEANNLRSADYGETNFQISQRADFINEIIGIATTSPRNLINRRDEPHADSDLCRRLHVIIGDANFCDWSYFLRVGTYALVLRMLEDCFIGNSPVCVDNHWLEALYQTSRDLTCKKKLQIGTASQSQMNPIEIQRWYLGLVKEYLAEFKGSAEDHEVCEKWEYVLNALDNDPNQLFGVLDWVTKKCILDQYLQHQGLLWQDSRLRVIDIAYHNISDEAGLYYQFLKKGKIQKLINNELLMDRVHNPPVDTRAYLRGKIARLYPEFVEDWEIISNRMPSRFRKEQLDSLRVILEEKHIITLGNPVLTREESEEIFKQIINLLKSWKGGSEDVNTT